MQENNNQAEPVKAISNGRNRRRCSNKATNAAPQAPVCGLIEDTSVFTEKLTGQHNKGYVDNSQAQEVAVEDSEVTVITNSPEEAQAEESTCECSKESPKENSEENSEETPKDAKYKGPSFEETKNTQKRTLEVSLKKVPHKSEKVTEKDAVSYSKVSASMKDKPKKRGLLSKIKSLFSKLLGKKSKKNSRNFKNNKGGYKKNYSKGKKRNNFDKGAGFEKNKDNSFRPNNKRKNYNKRPNNSYNKNKTTNTATTANKE